MKINSDTNELKTVKGQTVELLGVILAADATHDWEALPMYKVRLPDQSELEVWGDELEPSPATYDTDCATVEAAVAGLDLKAK